MRAPFLLVCLTAGSCLAGAEYTHKEHHWDFSGDVIFMQRNHVRNKPLVKDANKPRSCNNCGSYTVINTKSLVDQFDYDPGFHLAAVYNKDVKNSFEAAGMWISPWEAERKAKGNHSLFFPFVPDDSYDYNHANQARAKYQSHFWDLELNFWRHFSLRRTDSFSLSGIFGFCYFNLDEKFKLTFVKPPNTSNYSVRTANEMFGVQMGLNLKIAPKRRLSCDLTAKAGVMGNRILDKLDLYDQNDNFMAWKFKARQWQGGALYPFKGSAQLQN